MYVPDLAFAFIVHCERLIPPTLLALNPQNAVSLPSPAVVARMRNASSDGTDGRGISPSVSTVLSWHTHWSMRDKMG